MEEKKPNKYAYLLGNTNAVKYEEKDLDKMTKIIADYFEEQDRLERPYTINGIATALGICKQTFAKYAESGPFSPLLKMAKQITEQQIEENGLLGKANATFSIFNLKNNYGWKDQQEIKTTSDVNVSPLGSAFEKLSEAVKDD